VARFDAIVVGAGPAGSTTAYHLARAGASVLLLDRARFPRDKPCGGGVSARAARLLPFSIENVVEDRVKRLRCRLAYGPRFERRARREVVLMTQRRRLDYFLLERAAEAGADVRDGVRVADVRPGGLTIDGSEVSAHVLIGADGCNGTSARALGLGGDVVHGVALEANVPYGAVRRDRYRGRLVLEIAALPGGYGWIFPKADHVNVGVYGWSSEGPRLRGHLVRLCEEHGIDPGSTTRVRGYRLPMRRPSSPLACGSALVIGDAAGLVDPFSGDGMYEAFLSAKLAADAALELLAGRASGLESYEREVARRITPLTAAGWGAKVAFDRFPRLTFALARLPVTWRVLEKLLAGELSHPGATRGLERGAMRLVYGVAKRAGDPGRAYLPQVS
jgi:geranylgeranyl reductase family protein